MRGFREIGRAPGRGDLEGREVEKLETHLATCAGCRSFADGLRESQAALKELRLDTVDEAVFAATRARALARIREQQARPSLLSWWRVALVPLAAVLVFFLLTGEQETPKPQTVSAPRRPRR